MVRQAKTSKDKQRPTKTSKVAFAHSSYLSWLFETVLLLLIHVTRRAEYEICKNSVDNQIGFSLFVYFERFDQRLKERNVKGVEDDDRPSLALFQNVLSQFTSPPTPTLDTEIIFRKNGSSFNTSDIATVNTVIE